MHTIDSPMARVPALSVAKTKHTLTKCTTTRKKNIDSEVSTLSVSGHSLSGHACLSGSTARTEPLAFRSFPRSEPRDPNTYWGGDQIGRVQHDGDHIQDPPEGISGRGLLA